jgi:hypothetical protein
MKKKDVQIGAVYSAKVSGRVVDVVVQDESPYGGWYGENLETGRQVRIKTAQRLRRRVAESKRDWFQQRRETAHKAMNGGVKPYAATDPFAGEAAAAKGARS